ncbi:peroxin-12 [Wolffia australiana]
MLFQVAGQGSRPTFFEMAAAQQLPASLRAALAYSFGVFALRRPFFHKILDYEDEFFSLLMLVLETHSLRTTDASFAESLYGLRRKAVDLTTREEGASLESAQLKISGLRRRQKVLSVAFLVALPYLKSKMRAVYNKEREARLQASLWGGDGDAAINSSDPYVDEREALPSREQHSAGSPSSSMDLVKRRVSVLVAACYPLIHASSEGMSFAYQLLYLLDATGFYNVGLHILGVQVCRASGQELMESSSRILKIRSRERERLRGPPWFKTVQKLLLGCIYTTLDYAQTGLIAAVFFFKMMEWWYQSAEERMSAPTVFPPPPAPPPPKIAQGGIPLPSDRALCPLCSQRRANPSVLAASGFVFCYPCIFKYVSQYKRCPLTLIPASVDQIRRLFHDL